MCASFSVYQSSFVQECQHPTEIDNSNYPSPRAYSHSVVVGGERVSTTVLWEPTETHMTSICVTP
jgi:hypothetical protein